MIDKFSYLAIRKKSGFIYLVRFMSFAKFIKLILVTQSLGHQKHNCFLAEAFQESQELLNRYITFWNGVSMDNCMQCHTWETRLFVSNIISTGVLASPTLQPVTNCRFPFQCKQHNMSLCKCALMNVFALQHCQGFLECWILAVKKEMPANSSTCRSGFLTSEGGKQCCPYYCHSSA